MSVSYTSCSLMRYTLWTGCRGRWFESSTRRHTASLRSFRGAAGRGSSVEERCIRSFLLSRFAMYFRRSIPKGAWQRSVLVRQGTSRRANRDFFCILRATVEGCTKISLCSQNAPLAFRRFKSRSSTVCPPSEGFSFAPWSASVGRALAFLLPHERKQT